MDYFVGIGIADAWWRRAARVAVVSVCVNLGVLWFFNTRTSRSIPFTTC